MDRQINRETTSDISLGSVNKVKDRVIGIMRVRNRDKVR